MASPILPNDAEWDKLGATFAELYMCLTSFHSATLQLRDLLFYCH